MEVGEVLLVLQQQQRRFVKILEKIVSWPSGQNNQGIAPTAAAVYDRGALHGTQAHSVL